MAITLTESAAAEIQRYREAQNVEPDSVLRMGVGGGGCAGLQYTLGFETSFDPDVDARYEHYGVAVVATKKMALHLDGTTIDIDPPKLTSYAFNIMLKGGFMYTTAGIGVTSVEIEGGVGKSKEPTYNFGGGLEIGFGAISVDVSPRLFIINTADSASRKNLLIMAGANYYFF